MKRIPNWNNNMTDNKKTRENIPKIVRMIIKEYQPYKVILFGSYASGVPTRDSDVDLLIVTEKRLKYEDTYKIRQASSNNFSIPVQLICVTDEEFMETKDVIGGIAYPASKYRKVLYERKA